MGVDYYICTNPACGETFPDCSDHGMCEKEHLLCGYCESKLPPHERDEDEGTFPSAVCPTCIAGGTIDERHRAALRALLECSDEISLMVASMPNCGYPSTKGILERARGLLKREGVKS